MALALGLGAVFHVIASQDITDAHPIHDFSGSLFNHSNQPNVTYTLDSMTDSIRYMTFRQIESGEELSIFYGHQLWFQPVEPHAQPQSHAAEYNEDDWGALPSFIEVINPYVDGDPKEVLAEEDLPFSRYKPPPEEEELESLRTCMSIRP